jgi:hypothetical protein
VTDPRTQDLRRCPVCGEDTLHERGRCEWSDRHHEAPGPETPPKLQPHPKGGWIVPDDRGGWRRVT